jgi:putative peptidoglycan lipid II flippase
MIKRLFSAQLQSITGAALLLGAASFLSRIVGLFRDRILAHQFGAGAELDIYTAAFRIPDFLYNIIIVGALSAGFIPIFLEIYQKEKKQAWIFTNRVISLTFLSLGAISLISFFALPYFIHILVPGFSDDATHQTLVLTRIMLFSPILLGLSAVVSSVLQSLRSFFVYSLTPIFYNLGIIFGTIFFVPKFGLQGLAWGVVLGAALHFLVQVPILFHYGFSFSPQFSINNTSVKKLLTLMVPRTITLATMQISVLIVTFFASSLHSGSIAIFSFANNITSLPIGIIGISFAVAAFPTLSDLAVKNNTKEFASHISSTTRQILFFILPLTVIFISLRAQIVRVLLGSGQFNWEDTIVTASTVGMFSIALFAHSLIPLYTRAFYAFHNTKTPFLRAILSLIITTILCLILKPYFGVAGLALGISLSAILELFLLILSLKKIIHVLDAKRIITAASKMFLSASIMAFTIQILKSPLSKIFDVQTFLGIFLQGFIAGGIGILLYFLFGLFFRLDEAELFLHSLRKKWLKIKNVQPEATDLN